MKISFHGAARTVTGTKHMVTLKNGKRILLDCGLFQGLGAETDDLNERFGFNPQKVDCMILSHAHIDHTGLIPKLVKEGFTGKIYCTEATRDLTEILLYDSAEIQTYEIEYINKRREKKGLKPYEPLYTTDDVKAAMQLFEPVSYDAWHVIDDQAAFVLTNTGHLIGSAAITLKVHEDGIDTTIAFSGDIGRYRSVLLQPPAEFPQADYIIMESTYGDKHHDIRFNTIENLQQWIREVCVENGGQLVIPAFSVGRTQEVLYALNQLYLEKRLPEVPYFVDSPLSKKATEMIKNFTAHYSDRLQQVMEVDDDPFHFPGLNFIETVDESRQLTASKVPCVIISASGTADAGRVRHHINSIVGDEKSGILFVGYCGAKSLGGQLQAGVKEVEIFNDATAVKCKIGSLHGMSAHGDRDEMIQFLSCQDPEKVKHIFLVHGEYEVQKAFADRLALKGFKNVHIPEQHEVVDVSIVTLNDAQKTAAA